MLQGKGLEVEFTRHGIELDNLRLPTLLRLLYAAFAAGGILGFYGGIVGTTELLCADEPKKRRRFRQMGLTISAMLGLTSASVLYLTSRSSKGSPATCC